MTMLRRLFLGAAATFVLALPIRDTVPPTRRSRARVAFVASFVAANGIGPDPIDPFVRAFVHGLRDLGLIDGTHIAIERRSTEGRVERAPAIMRELVERGVDVIVTVGGPAVLAAHRASERIAIVALVDDVLDMGLVDSLARPGHNLTGIGESDPNLHGKRLEMLKEAAPSISRIAVICYRQGPNDRGDWRRQLDAAARTMKLEVLWLDVDVPEQFDAAFATLLHRRADALYVTATHVNDLHARRIAEFAIAHRLPSFGFAEQGQLLGYWSDSNAVSRRAAVYVKKILEGARPGELPFEQPTRFELAINLKTAQALGLELPPSLLLRADALIR